MSDESRPTRRLLSRLGPIGVGVAILLGVSAPFAVPPLADAVSGQAPAAAEIVQPLTYLLGAPLFGAWDTISLLTASQHYAVVVTLLALYVGARSRAPRRKGALPARAAREVARGSAALLLLLAFYAAGALIPRPMVGMRLADPELLSIDFHSHTAHSHDGWSLFGARRNRAWHEAGGFDAAYVTDHYTWAGVEDAVPLNPARAGERTALLEGAELRIHRRPTNALGARARYRWAVGPDTIYMDPDSLRAHPLRDGRPPTLLFTMPGALGLVVPYTQSDPSGVIGIEVNDGSPRGLEQTRSERAAIVAMADSVDLALVAASNLHGWGRTVSAWSVMRIPGWREMTPEQLADRIEGKLHAERRASGTVVERRMPYHGGSGVRIALTAPWLAWEHFRMLTVAERLSWLLWLAVLVGVRTPRRAAAGAAGARLVAGRGSRDRARPQ